MKGAPGSRPGGGLGIYDVAINARDPSARQVFRVLLILCFQCHAATSQFVLREERLKLISAVWCLLINAAFLFCSPSDVMTVLRQLQTFLLTQHSRDQTALQDYILRALLGVCQVCVFYLVGFHKNAADVKHHALARTI